MKYISFFLLIFYLARPDLIAQNIGINATGATPNASAMLDVSATDKGMLVPRMSSPQRMAIGAPAKGLLVFDNDTGSFWFYNGTAWTELTTGGGSAGWTSSGPDIYTSNPGNVGIGTTTPLSKLALLTPDNTNGFSHTSAGGIVLTEAIGGVSASIGTSSNHVFRLSAGPGESKLQIYPTGDVVVGGNSVAAAGRLTVSTPLGGFGMVHTDGIVSVGSFVDGLSGYYGTISNHPLRFFANNTGGQFSLLANGNIGIGENNPANKLQIGSVGAAGFNGNDLAIGNGTNAMALFQSNASSLLGSTTDIVLMPRNNGQGRVGINTATPRAPLEVSDNTTVTALSSFYSYLNFASFSSGVGSSSANPVVSILASSRVYATEFDAYSDARIKRIAGPSSTARDLRTINALQITDYTMKDRIKYGDKPYKKVIAQEVEKVYPQVVSRHTDFVPDVYQLTDKIEKTANGYLLHFAGKHHISPRARRLQLVLSETEGMRSFDILSLPSETEVIIQATDIHPDKVFVYGEEVDDFRTVDYEGLMTLNISATQELSKLEKKQQAVITLLEKRLAALELKESARKIKMP
jgi:hypothetical protein